MGGVINPAVCLGTARLCQGPSVAMRSFEPSQDSRRGVVMSPEEHAHSSLASSLICINQNPVSGCAAQNLLVYCYVNPGLAGHGAQAHSMAEALSYAVASNRSLVVDDACPWDLHPAGGKGFWETYMQPLSVCSCPTNAARMRPGTAGQASPKGLLPDVLMWDTDAAKSRLAVPQGAKEWCKGSLVWTKSCTPPAVSKYSSAWWHAHARCPSHRPWGFQSSATAQCACMFVSYAVLRLSFKPEFAHASTSCSWR